MKTLEQCKHPKHEHTTFGHDDIILWRDECGAIKFKHGFWMNCKRNSTLRLKDLTDTLLLSS